MRSLAFALATYYFLAVLVDVLQTPSQKYLKTEISDIGREDNRDEEESTESTTITPEDCEDRGGTWFEEREECSFDSDRPEEETERPEEETERPEEETRPILFLHVM